MAVPHFQTCRNHLIKYQPTSIHIYITIFWEFKHSETPYNPYNWWWTLLFHNQNAHVFLVSTGGWHKKKRCGCRSAPASWEAQARARHCGSCRTAPLAFVGVPFSSELSGDGLKSLKSNLFGWTSINPINLEVNRKGTSSHIHFSLAGLRFQAWKLPTCPTEAKCPLVKALRPTQPCSLSLGVPHNMAKDSTCRILCWWCLQWVFRKVYLTHSYSPTCII